MEEYQQNYIEGAKHFYDKNVALGLESTSGYTSSLAETFYLRDFVKKIIRDKNISSLADCPCGDLNWIRATNLDGVEYTGYDVLDAHINTNSRLFPKLKFIKFDAVREILPKTDLILCKDFLTHLVPDLIRVVLDNFKQSGSKWLLSTSYPEPVIRTMDESSLKVISWGFHEINLLDYGLTPVDLCRDSPKRIHGLYALNV